MTQTKLYALEERYERVFNCKYVLPEHVPLLWSLIGTDIKKGFFRQVLGD